MRRIHIIGIKGAATSALAELFAKRGFEISGSDVKDSFPTDKILRRLKIKVKSFSAQNISDDLDFVVYSGAYPENNLERKKAAELRIPQISYGEALALFFNQKQGIAVSGCHGKTTTSALLAHLLKKAGLKPSAVVGGMVKNWESNSLSGDSEFFVVEADEYQKKFLSLKPQYIVITNIDYDHPDTFKDKNDYIRGFRDFAKNLKKGGKIVVHQSEIRKLGGNLKSSIIYPQTQDEKILRQSKFSLLGEHNRQNALLAVRLARFLKIKPVAIKAGLADFKGVKRRIDFWTNPKSDFVIIDDYAHHPKEIKATLKTLRENFGNYHIVAVFQSHTYSRTKLFFKEFAKSFGKADEIILLPIYSSAREKARMKKDRSLDLKFFKEFIKYNRKVVFSANYKKAEKEVLRIKKLKSHLLVATIGAGQVWQIAEKLTIGGLTSE
ncbi:MAG: hypothetical protein A3H02_02750 [Candidatus Niyogibacteria bacterium RIFCSPLOWO2_12_FULL_41_13]|uniref:UDP-N-acetylmuramate--L-alanine ligase n=1 Tax=Candidatus Niyogibacteria bacterium RIFCSPLOWO2_12_FULL_41_13 TaxID=1801726 RepID=A0A1G2F1W7_9BACT|nr:MAG: hypothetical protein A3H02_02750 [Candidatus Niyogibacteria bacterium RIFCSPLOWO2_12_FULL_41_13]